MPYLHKKDLIRNELLKCARASPMEFPTCTIFGRRVGIPAQGPWESVLDQISREQTSRGQSDITFLIINKTTGYPSRVGFVTRRKLTPGQKQHAHREVQKVIDQYNPGTPNPF
jgi:hypothetical protein